LMDLAWGVLIGASRKSWIEKLTGAAIEERLPGSLVAAVHAVAQGTEVIRTHDVLETAQAIKVGLALTPPPKT